MTQSNLDTTILPNKERDLSFFYKGLVSANIGIAITRALFDEDFSQNTLATLSMLQVPVAIVGAKHGGLLQEQSDSKYLPQVIVSAVSVAASTVATFGTYFMTKVIKQDTITFAHNMQSLYNEMIKYVN